MDRQTGFHWRLGMKVRAPKSCVRNLFGSTPAETEEEEDFGFNALSYPSDDKTVDGAAARPVVCCRFGKSGASKAQDKPAPDAGGLLYGLPEMKACPEKERYTGIQSPENRNAQAWRAVGFNRPQQEAQKCHPRFADYLDLGRSNLAWPMVTSTSDMHEDIRSLYSFPENNIRNNIGADNELIGQLNTDGAPVTLKMLVPTELPFLNVNSTKGCIIEAAVLQKLQRPDTTLTPGLVPRVINTHSSMTSQYIVLERLPNSCSLRELITANRHCGIGEKLSRYLFVNIYLGLRQIMNVERIFHGDLNDANVTVDLDQACVQFQNFESSDYCDAAYRYNRRVGTDGFLPPECYMGRRTYTADGKTVFALGVLLYTMLSGGDLPFPTGSGLTTDAKYRELSHVSEECRAVIRACLQLEESKRITMKRIRDLDWIANDEQEVTLLWLEWSIASSNFLLTSRRQFDESMRA